MIEDNRLVLQAMISRTNDDEVNIIKPTDNVTNTSGVFPHRIVDRQVATRWGTLDIEGVIQQVGVLNRLEAWL